MARSFNGKIPSVPIDADTSRADEKVDRLFDKIKGLERVKIDADVSQAERRLNNLVRKSNKQISTNVFSQGLKDFRFLLSAMQTEFSNNGETSIYKNLERTYESFMRRFADISVKIGDNNVNGLTNVLNSFADFDRISSIQLVPDNVVDNSKELLDNTRKTAKAQQEIVLSERQAEQLQKIRLIKRRAQRNAIKDDNLQAWEKRQGTLLEDRATLSEIIKSDNPVLKSACQEAMGIVDIAMRGVEEKISKAQAAIKEAGTAAGKSAADTIASGAAQATSSISKFQSLLDDLGRKYGDVTFSSVFGGILSSFKAINESNASQAYDALIAKDKEYQVQLEAERQTREKIAKEVEAYNDATKYIFQSGTPSQDILKVYTAYWEKVSAGAMNATDAIKAFEEEWSQFGSAVDYQQKKQIDEIRSLIRNQEEWLKYLEQSLNPDNFKTSGKKEATQQLRDLTNRLTNARRNDYKDDMNSQYNRQMVEVAWAQAYKEAQKQGVAQSTLARYRTDALGSYDDNLRVLQEAYDYRKKALAQYEEELKKIKQITSATEEQATRAITSMSQLGEVLDAVRTKYKELSGRSNIPVFEADIGRAKVALEELNDVDILSELYNSIDKVVRSQSLHHLLLIPRSIKEGYSDISSFGETIADQFKIVIKPIEQVNVRVLALAKALKRISKKETDNGITLETTPERIMNLLTKKEKEAIGITDRNIYARKYSNDDVIRPMLNGLNFGYGSVEDTPVSTAFTFDLDSVIIRIKPISDLVSELTRLEKAYPAAKEQQDKFFTALRAQGATNNQYGDIFPTLAQLQAVIDLFPEAQQYIDEIQSRIQKPVVQQSLQSASGKMQEETKAIETNTQATQENIEVKDKLSAQQSTDGNIAPIQEEAKAIEANTQAIEENVQAKKKSSKIKLREFTREEYDEYQEQYENEHDDYEDLYDTVDVIRSASKFGTQFETQMFTSCKRATTAVNRFFSAFDLDKYPQIVGWKEGILEAIQSGVFSESETYKGMHTGSYTWGVEELDDERFYVFLNLLDVAKDKEAEYTSYLQEEYRKRDEGLEKQSELIYKVFEKKRQLEELHTNKPSADNYNNDALTFYQAMIDYLEQERLILQDIDNLRKQYQDIPLQYRDNKDFGESRAFGASSRLGENADYIDYYNKLIERAKLDARTTPSGQIGMFEGMADPIFEAVDATEELSDSMQGIPQISGQISFDEAAEEMQKVAEATREATEAKRKYYEIDEKAARLSKQMRSFDDYKEGSATASYKAAVDEMARIVEEKKVQFPDKSEQLDKWLDQYAKNLATYINRDNQIGAQYPSVMISGAGNYNIKKHNKQMASWGKNYQYYDDKVLSIASRIKNLGSAGTDVIRGDESDALERLEAKLEYMKYWHDVMVEVNKYYRKNKTLDGFEGVEPDELERIKQDLATMKQLGMHDVPYPQYTLSNDNQNIKRIEGRIAELKRLKGNEGLQEENEIYKLWTDKQDMRIRISFEIGKPEQEIIDLLKGSGFKWSPKNQAWQRQLTDNAVYATKNIQKKLREHYQITGNAQLIMPQEQIPTPVQPTVSPNAVETAKVYSRSADQVESVTEQLTQGIQQVGDAAEQTTQQLEQQTTANEILAESSEQTAQQIEQQAETTDVSNTLRQLEEFDELYNGFISAISAIDINGQIQSQLQPIVQEVRGNIEQGLLSASDAFVKIQDATNQLYNKLQEPSTLPELSVSERVATIGNGTIDNLLKTYNITNPEAQAEIVNVFDEMARTIKAVFEKAKVEGPISNKDDLFVRLQESADKASDLIIQLGIEARDTGESLDELRDFYKFMQGIKIKYNDSIKAEYGDAWAKFRNRFSKYLTTSPTAQTADSLYKHLSGDVSDASGLPNADIDTFRGFFPQDITTDIEQFVRIFEVLGKALDASKGGRSWKRIDNVPLTDASNDEKQYIRQHVSDIQRGMIATLRDISDASVEALHNEEQLAEREKAVGDAVRDTNEARKEGNKLQKETMETAEDESEKERQSIIERNEDTALKVLREAKDNKTNLVDLSNVYSTSDLKSQLESMATQITDSKKIPLSVGDIRIQDNIAAVTMYNEALGITYRQLYKVSEAADDASKSQLELWSESYDENYKAAKKYSEAQKKKIAKDDSWLISQASKLNTQERKYKYSDKKIEGATALTDADETSLAEGADKTIDSLAKHIRSRIQASMGQGLTDEVRNQITNDLRILNNEIKIEQYKKYSSTTMKSTELDAAKKELEYTLQSLEAKAKKNNVFSEIEQDVISLRSQLQGVKDGTQLSKFIDDLRVAKSKLNAEIAKEQTTKREEQNYQNLINLQNRLYEAKKKLNELKVKGQLDTAEGQQASRRVQELQDQYDLSVKLLQNEEHRKAIEERGADLDSQLNTTKNQKQIEQYYQDIFDTVQRINNLDSQINTLKMKDGGKGIYSDLIASLESEKFTLLSKIDQIGADVQQYFNGVFASVGDAEKIQLPFNSLLKDTQSYNTILDFLNSIDVRATLGADAVNKLVQALYNSSQAGSEFAEKINAQFKPAEQAFARLQQIIRSGGLNVDNNETYQQMKQTFDRLKELSQTDVSKWSAEGIAYFIKLANSVTEYANNLSKAAEQEAQYFRNKQQNEYSNPILALPEPTNMDSAQTKLENYVRAFKDGKAIITGFNTSADGISKIEFSWLDEATGKIRKFYAELGQFTNTIHDYEVTAQNSTFGTDAVNKSLDTISQTITRLQNIQGAEGAIELLKQKAMELRDKLSEIGSSKDTSDQNILKNVALDADNAVKSANRLAEALLKVQNAINGNNAKDFNFNALNKSVDTIDQMITRLTQVDGTESIVAKLKDQLAVIQSAFKAPDLNTEAGQTRLKNVLADTEKLIKSTNTLEKEWAKAQAGLDDGKLNPLGQININGDTQSQMWDLIQSRANGARASFVGFDDATNTLTYTLNNSDRTVTTMTAHMNGLNGVVTTQQGETKKLVTGWQEFTGAIRGGFNTLKQYVGRMFSIMAIVGQLKQGFNAVKEIDASLTELKKVTDETEMSYRNFLNTASQTAGKIGSTVSDFTKATSNFARLGYTMDESAKMAETAIVYKNVADGLDTVEESTESIISTMKAFGIESNDTMGIIDRFNEVGNNFAITSAGIGEALQRSASALYEAGNTIDESIGLVTAAMKNWLFIQKCIK